MVDKSHRQQEIREYYQREDGWLQQKKQWKGLKSAGMEKKTIQKEEIAAQNQNIIWKWCLSMLKLIEELIKN